MNVADLPPLNASLNFLAFVLLWRGRNAIKRGDRNLHRRYMQAALVASGVFLTFYLIYHYNSNIINTYQGVGWDRWLYYSILITHVPLATLMLPFIAAAVYYAWRGNFVRHTKITRWLWPVWMYVSFTGVLVYAMLYHLYKVL